ncbi:hypothetical protein FGIG_08888 [Fasciola gigantica]|uniref:Uncharacterized protein n=1 Tax=Fasciola gigantica TaxID=46835 RepID=A0A504YH80_FASGI|nr:hypothetical protein FGIG_08888 [Fasciola gigantica]
MYSTLLRGCTLWILMLSLTSCVLGGVYLHMASDVFPEQLRDRIICDSVTVLISSISLVPVEKFRRILLKMIVTFMRIILFVDICSNVASLHISLEKLKVIATVSWLWKTRSQRMEYMTLHRCCGLLKQFQESLSDALLCAESVAHCCLTNGTASCCPNTTESICTCNKSCLPALVETIRMQIYLFAAISMLISFSKAWLCRA